MVLNVFDELKTRLNFRTVAEHCGIKTERGGMTVCPFHNDKTPSAKIYSENLHCFVCNKSWDSVGLVCELFGLQPIDAARKLSNDFVLDLFPNKPLTAAERREAAAAQQARQDETDIDNVVTHYISHVYGRLCDILHAFQAVQDSKTAALSLKHYVKTRINALERWIDQFQNTAEFTYNTDPDTTAIGRWEESPQLKAKLWQKRKEVLNLCERHEAELATI